METKGRLEIISVWGYNSGGHYVVSKGVYYNNTSGNYEFVVNDPHYKFAGGREINVSLQDLFDANKEELLYGTLLRTPMKIPPLPKRVPKRTFGPLPVLQSKQKTEFR